MRGGGASFTVARKMSACPYCHADVPTLALCCVQCGRELVTETVQDQATQERLRDLLVAKGLLAADPGQFTPPAMREGIVPAPPAPLIRSGSVSAQGGMSTLTPLATAQDNDGFSLQFEDTLSPAPAMMPESELPPSTPAPAVSAVPTPPERPSAGGGGGPAPVTFPPGHPDRMPASGDIIDQYEVKGEIGRGGMGRVYHAVHRLTGQEVALKMLLPQFSQDPRLRARFLNEAKVLAKLEHPNLVPLLAFLEIGTRAFIVMPFIKGITLERMMRRQGRLSIDIVVDLFDQLCAAIEHVHRHGVLHRDLKPSNVIVRGDGRVMVTDFGIARAVGSEMMTLPGMVVGTAEYLSPEQACGASKDDKRSDIYSLGILLYEMLTGQVPFHHPSAAEVLQRQVNAAPPPPRLVVPELPPALETVMLRALAKDPEKRFQSALEFANVVRTTVWPKPGTEEVRAGELAAAGFVAPGSAAAVRGAGSLPARPMSAPGGSAPATGVPGASLPVTEPAASNVKSPPAPAPEAAAPPLTRGEMLRWGAVIAGLAALGAGIGAFLRLRG